MSALVAHPAQSSARVSRVNQTSQAEFTNRLKHLQRSKPVNAFELTRRLNAAIAESQSGVQSRRRRLVYTGDDNGEDSHSGSSSKAPTPRQHTRQTITNPMDIARSSLIITDQEEDDDPMSRVAKALKACRDADPEKSVLKSAPGMDDDKRQHKASPIEAWNEFAKTAQTHTYQSIVFSNPWAADVDSRLESIERPKSAVPLPHISNAMMKRKTRKVPPPLILTVVPKVAKAEIVDVSSPIKTKLPSKLPDLEPLSPFSSSFVEDTGSFLVYQSDEIRHSTLSSGVNSLANAGGTTSDSPVKAIVPLDCDTAPSVKSQDSSQTQAKSQQAANIGLSRYARDDRKEHHDTCSSALGRDLDGRAILRTSEGIRVASFVLSEKSETEGADERSERAVTPIFDPSIVHSSRTSFGQPTTVPQAELKCMPSKRIERSTEDIIGPISKTALSQTLPDASPSNLPSPPVSPLPQGMDYEAAIGDHDVSPLGSPTLTAPPRRVSLLPQVEPQSPGAKRFSIPRKPVNSGTFDVLGQDVAAMRAPQPRSVRHDSTGFIVAKEFIRNSVDSEPLRLVHSAAHRGSDSSSTHPEPVSRPSPLPKLTTPGLKRANWELIADGIALMDSDSPNVAKYTQKLSTSTNPSSRQPSYINELEATPDQHRQKSTHNHSPRVESLSPALNPAQQLRPALEDLRESEAIPLKRAASRDRRHTDATVTSMCTRTDYRARPLIQDSAETPAPHRRPRTAHSKMPEFVTVSTVPPKMPTKIKFPPRANVVELGVMSPESLKLLHEQEALLRKRYDAVLNPIDDALKKKYAPSSEKPATKDIDQDVTRYQEQIEREQAAIRMQRRYLGAAVTRPSAPERPPYDDQISPVVQHQHQKLTSGEPIGLPGGLPHSNSQSQCALSAEDDTQGRRKKGKWKFWKVK
ncbi:uncharacterized protein PV09_02841 [Verruconis gallopava]|uniref:Uncharacterized protein n=1 Tax=Verruconis gallopava TaxID=253628 RepID=A0A0D2AHJ7_9PEZI|nr:uncharacterized protein PV09_02841 [Verruconis gallopava]KIW06388.1 hypothetical protein PV09_02841 [Verruconis gallopava]